MQAVHPALLSNLRDLQTALQRPGTSLSQAPGSRRHKSVPKTQSERWACSPPSRHHPRCPQCTRRGVLAICAPGTTDLSSSPRSCSKIPFPGPHPGSPWPSFTCFSHVQGDPSLGTSSSPPPWAQALHTGPPRHGTRLTPSGADPGSAPLTPAPLQRPTASGMGSGGGGTHALSHCLIVKAPPFRREPLTRGFAAPREPKGQRFPKFQLKDGQVERPASRPRRTQHTEP